MHYYAQGRREKKKPTGVLGEGGSSFLVKTKGKKRIRLSFDPLHTYNTFPVPLTSCDKITKKAPFPLNCTLHIYRVFFFTFFLVLGSTALGELKDDIAACQPPIHLTVCIKAVVDTTTLLLVQDDLESLAAILLGAGALANNLNWVDNVGEDGVMDGG
jgi:hypothetical protein